MRSKKLFRTYNSSRLRGAGRAVDSVFIRFAPLSLLINKLLKFKAVEVLRNTHKVSQVGSALCEFSY